MYHARELAMMAAEGDGSAIWALPEGPIKVIFDDGVLESNNRATIFSAYTWAAYVRYPKTPTCMAHHLGERILGGDTTLEMLGRVMWDVYDAYEQDYSLEDRQEFIEILSEQVYQDTNRIYNHFSYRLERYVRTLSILDMIDVIHHPAIKAANDAVKPTQFSIDQTYRAIRNVLTDPRELIGNPVAIAARNKLVSMGQIQQCVGPRGFVTDIDSNIFADPILTGYVHGIRTLGDLMRESRSASKSLSFTEEPLQKTEYFNRRMQLLAHTMKWVVPGDCGSQHYLTWRVVAGDLDRIAGKFYVTDSGLKRVKETDRHLIGELIEMRSVLHCLHPESDSVCSTCFGDLSKSIPRQTNIGHVSSTALCAEITQRVMSVKHEDGSSTVDTIELSEYDQQYIRLGTDVNTIKLADRLEHKRVILSIDGKEAEHLSDVQYVEDVRDLPIGLISRLNQVDLKITSKSKEEVVTVPVAVGTRLSSMTHDLLDHVKKHGWTTTATGKYQIDLTHWDMELPMFALPLKHMNMLDYMETIESFIKGSTIGAVNRTMRDCDSPEAALKEFYTLVSSHLFVNIAHLEILVKVSMIRSERNRDYRIPYEGNAIEFGSFNQTMSMRSLPAMMAFERQKFVFNNPATYLVENRSTHILDPLLFRGE